MTFSPQFKHKCEVISTEWRIKLKLRAFDKLPSALLLEQLQAAVVTPHEVTTLEESYRLELLRPDSSWSAQTLRTDPLLILYNPQHAATRHEANMMHELAHFILEHPMIGFDPETGMLMRDPVCEEEASYLGSCLQIPRRGLAWAIQKNMNLEQIAQHFGASPALVQYRSNLTGLKVTTTAAPR